MFSHRLLVVVIFGLMGTGKTKHARALGAALGLPVVHSDEVRKTLAGLTPTTKVPLNYGLGIYHQEFSERTYREMRRLARQHLAAAPGVILDASYKRARERARVRQLARKNNARAIFIYCTCPPQVARERLGIRLTDPQAISDGRVELFATQAADFDPLTADDQPVLRLDTNRDFNLAGEELRNFVLTYQQQGETDAT